MARFPYLTDEQADGRVQLLWQGCRDLLGRVPNSMRLYAYVPKIAIWFLPFLASLQREGAGGLLEGRVKQLSILKTSMTNSCMY